MDRNDALDRLCREGVFMVAPLYAEVVAAALGRTLEQISLEPKVAKELAKEPLGPWQPGSPHIAGSIRVQRVHTEDKAVFMHELSARVAMSYGLYANIDHAMQSPYHRAASECRYIACRGAIRLARLFGGQGGVDALRERNPWIEKRLFTETPYTGTGQRLS